MEYTVTDKDGTEIRQGDTVTDFRGDPATFERVSRGPQPGKSAKVIVSRGTYTFETARWPWSAAGEAIESELYCTVFDLTVTER